MGESSTHYITEQLQRWAKGSSDAFVPEIYEELSRIARSRLKMLRSGHSLEPASMVNEAYLRLREAAPVEWQNRRHFYCTAAKMMRFILVNYVREKASQKRGGHLVRVLLEPSIKGPTPGECMVEEVHKCLEELAQMDQRQADIIEMRFFAGMSVSEVAETLGIAEITVKRGSESALAWIRKRLSH